MFFRIMLGRVLTSIGRRCSTKACFFYIAVDLMKGRLADSRIVFFGDVLNCACYECYESSVLFGRQLIVLYMNNSTSTRMPVRSLACPLLQLLLRAQLVCVSALLLAAVGRTRWQTSLRLHQYKHSA